MVLLSMDAKGSQCQAGLTVANSAGQFESFSPRDSFRRGVGARAACSLVKARASVQVYRLPRDIPGIPPKPGKPPNCRRLRVSAHVSGGCETPPGSQKSRGRFHRSWRTHLDGVAFHQALVQGRPERAGTDRVDVNIKGCESHRVRLSPTDNGGLGRVVGVDSSRRPAGPRSRRYNDLALSALLH